MPTGFRHAKGHYAGHLYEHTLMLGSGLRSMGDLDVHTVVLWRQPGVVEMLMTVEIIIIIAAADTIIGCFLCATHHSKHFTGPNSFTLYNSAK